MICTSNAAKATSSINSKDKTNASGVYSGMGYSIVILGNYFDIVTLKKRISGTLENASILTDLHNACV